MDDVHLRKQEIQGKLAVEKKRSEMIKESLAHADELTNNMVTILNQFDERLHRLEDTVLPLHRKTKDLQRLQDNIDKTVSALEHVIGYHHVAHDIDSTLQQGPSGQVTRFIDGMNRLFEAIDFFSENSPDSPELNAVNMLFTNGKEKLEREFHYQLTRFSKPIQPLQILEMIKQDFSPVDCQGYLPDKSIKELAQIALWLSGPGKSLSFTKSYSEIRSKVLVLTLENLRDHFRNFSPNLSSKKGAGSLNTPKKGARRPSTFSRKASTLLRKESMPSLTNMGGKGAHPVIAEEEVNDLELEPFIKMLSACCQLLMAENSVMHQIIPEKHKRKVFDELVINPLSVLVQLGYKFITFAKQCISAHDHPSIISIFSVIQHLKKTSPIYCDVLKFCSESNRRKLPQLTEELESFVVKVLDDFTDCVKSDPEKESNMPKDGTVHELTSNTMLFMQQLSQNADVSSAVLASQQFESPPSVQMMRKCLAQYISHVLGALKLNLENKSRVYTDSALAAIFLLNNYQFILNALDRHGLLILVEMVTPEVEKIYRGIIKEQKLVYLHCWNKLHAHMSNEARGFTIETHPGIKLKDKEKQAVKDKFKSFNSDFEELIRVQQQWAIPNVSIKDEVRNMVKMKIVPDYEDFRNKYKMVQFTKNIDKYLKYTPEDVQSRIGCLFDQTSQP